MFGALGWLRAHLLRGEVTREFSLGRETVLLISAREEGAETGQAVVEQEQHVVLVNIGVKASTEQVSHL
jgi:hypothetical protein